MMPEGDLDCGDPLEFGRLLPPEIAGFLGSLDPAVEDFRFVRLVLLNGPPGCGKDTAARHLERTFAATQNVKFAEALKRSVFVDVGIPYDTPIDFFDAVKDEPLGLFGGRSFRQACIEKSEQFGKPIYGDAHYGRVFLRRAAQAARAGVRLLAVSDSGFSGEARAILPYFSNRAMLVRIHALGRGKSFAGDSRNYIHLPEIPEFDLRNDIPSNPARFLSDLVDLVGTQFPELWRRQNPSRI